MPIRVKIEWVATGEAYIEVSDEDAEALFDKNSPSSAPCHLDDLPKQTRQTMSDTISETLFDGPIDINSIAETAGNPRRRPKTPG